jgi:uncharacterized protein with HEPN domain
MSRDSAYLADILRAAKAIARFVSGVDKQQFIANEEKYEAVNRKFEIIGEAARHLSPEVRRELPDVPWQLITAMRNILIHNYDDVNLNVVWDTIQDDLPPLMAKVEAYLNAHPPDAAPPAPASSE